MVGEEGRSWRRRLSKSKPKSKLEVEEVEVKVEVQAGNKCVYCVVAAAWLQDEEECRVI